MRRREAAAGLLGLLLLTACGAGARPAAARGPVASPSAPPPVPFTGTIARTPGAPVRFGPGTDMPVMDVDPAGRTDSFDGWLTRTDDAASGNWFHLADGRGWVSAAAVQGRPPAGAAPATWTPPATIPAPAAGLLDIPIDLQDQRATCEVAALKMALAGRGIATDERTLLAAAGIDRRAPELTANGAIVRWGDPNGSFVGDPNGNPPDHTGYGVYAAPIARAAAAAGATVAASGTGITPAALYAAVVAGRPAVAWVTNDYRPEPLGTWRAWDGVEVRYSLHEHAVTMIGVTPSAVLLDDPWFGQRWHARSEFEGAYGTFGDMAVILG